MNNEKIQTLKLFPEILIYANYLYECNYNTYEEVMSMNLKELEDRFNEVTKR